MYVFPNVEEQLATLFTDLVIPSRDNVENVFKLGHLVQKMHVNNLLFVPHDLVDDHVLVCKNPTKVVYYSVKLPIYRIYTKVL